MMMDLRITRRSSDGDGILDVVEFCDTDDDGTSDYRDLDSDGDGLGDRRGREQTILMVMAS